MKKYKLILIAVASTALFASFEAEAATIDSYFGWFYLSRICQWRLDFLGSGSRTRARHGMVVCFRSTGSGWCCKTTSQMYLMPILIA